MSTTKGFTIVELITVIVIIGVLATVAIVSYRGIQQRAKSSAALTTIDNWSKYITIQKTFGYRPAEMTSCLGKPSDFPAEDGFEAGECIQQLQNGQKTVGLNYVGPLFADAAAQKDMPSGKMPLTTYSFGGGITLRSRGIWSSGTAAGPVQLFWFPQSTGSCGRGGQLIPPSDPNSTDIDGDYCALILND